MNNNIPFPAKKPGLFKRVLHSLVPSLCDLGIPSSEPLPGVLQLEPRSHTFPPIGRTNCFVFGDPGHPKIIVDPAPKNDNEYTNLINVLRNLDYAFSGIFITHYHLDHHERAPRLARELSIPISLGKFAFQRIIERKKDYFDSIDINFVSDGDVVSEWSGNRVSVYALPGHTVGDLGLAPSSMEWFMVGDLVQSLGTVVIGKDDGDMKKYFESLERIIRFNPVVVLPAHGSPMKTSLLEKTLEHRIQRENQVLELYKDGKSPQQMVSSIYRNVNKKLWPFALENIESHIKKLKEEKKI
ncbi:MAG: MBL fold metallo-hydrolase [bacterium]|nr:MBL fold metallo-hydrolase [bacterium]